jgi:ABC-type oligopeptide transport system substrate-binding subunit
MKKYLVSSVLTASSLLLAACAGATSSSSSVVSSSSVSSSSVASSSTPAVEVPLAGFANGEFNFKFASTELRNTFFGAAEKWMLNTGAGGIPLYSNASFVMFSDRLKLFSEVSIPVMGFGLGFSEFTADDSTVTVEGVKGQAGRFTYRGALGSNPTSFNQWIANDATTSDAFALVLGSLYNFDFNAAKTGFVVIPELAGGDPVPVNETVLDTGKTVSKIWRVPIRAGLKWSFHSSVNPTAKGYDVNITADDFIDTYKLALDRRWFRAISGGSHFWSPSNPVKGAKEYYDAIVAGTAANWANVGIKKVVVGGVEHVEFEFTTDMSKWNVQYWLSSDVMSPVHTQMVAELDTRYATTAETTAFHGPYVIEYYEADKVIRYAKNPNFVFPTKFKFTHYNYQIIREAIVRFQSFLNGDLESGSVTTTQYEQFKNDPRLRRVPGATTFRLGINALKTPEAQEAKFPKAENGDWVPEPILGYPEMASALYFAIDRRRLAFDVVKTAGIQQFHFTDAYLVEAEEGIPWRNTPQAAAVNAGLSVETNGFNKAAATSFFRAAVAKAIAEGYYRRGDTIELTLVLFANNDGQIVLFQYMKEALEETFTDPANNIRVQLNPLFVPFPNNYYDYGLIGQFDLFIGGISGGTLDASAFLDVYASDNRGGFTFNWGFDTSAPVIDVTYTLGGRTVTEKWSFDAITMALNGPVKVLNGREVIE